MALTPHAVLRDLLLSELLTLEGEGTRAQVLAAIDLVYASFWTEEDTSPQASRPFDTKWRNRCSWTRMRLIEEGLLEPRDDGIWKLTAGGVEAAGSVADLGPASWRFAELSRRDAMWRSLGGADDALMTTAKLVRGSGMYSGARGIHADKSVTASAWAPDGAAVTFLNLGDTYADELSEDGVVNHYPSTGVAGRDASEITATHAAYESGLPVFVITKGDGASGSRTVHRGYIERLNDDRRLALITFVGGGQLPPPPPESETRKHFSITGEDDKDVWTKRRARPNQSRFAFSVTSRYGAACAVCGLNIPDALEAAHMRPKSKKGSDDARNGLVLCRNHHRMFDR